VPRWQADGEGERHVDEQAVDSENPELLSKWLSVSWKPIESALGAWSVEDLFQNYSHRFAGQVYAISRQWTLWRVLTHDTHHGGQIAMMLAMQGIPAHELRGLGGHIVAPPLVQG
jgi:uncharacterized damage-inducible protein DinB